MCVALLPLCVHRNLNAPHCARDAIGDAMVQRKLAKSCDCVAALEIQVDDATGVRRAEIEFTDPRCASECVDKVWTFVSVLCLVRVFVCA